MTSGRADGLPASDEIGLVRGLVGPGDTVHPLGSSELADSTRKFLVRSASGDPTAVVLISSPIAPGMVARAVRRAREVREALGEPLGKPVLLPLREGDLDGCGFAVFPYCTPLCDVGAVRHIQRWAVRSRVLRWLVAAAAKTLIDVPKSEHASRVLAPLRRLSTDPEHALGLREAASRALVALEAGEWAPKHTVMHDDLWSGNVLIDQASFGGSRFGSFVVIDWGGSRLDGYPFYDFLRLSCDMGLTGRAFFRALDAHCTALGSTREEATYQFALAAGEAGSRLEHWPRASYLTTIERCFKRMATGR